MLEELDTFIEGVIGEKGHDVSVLITSDHGNVEDLSTGGHTGNEAPLWVVGPMAEQL